MGEPARAARTAAESSSREDFVDATGRLLQRQGYAASGLNEIVARSGAPRGSLYFHFPGGKQELAAAAMERGGRRLRDAITIVLAAHEDPVDGIGALIDGMAAGLLASRFRDGCPVATVALEVAAVDDTLRAAACGAFDSWLDAIGERLRAAGLDAAVAERRALLVLAALEGALILARARREISPLEAVREELRELLA